MNGDDTSSAATQDPGCFRAALHALYAALDAEVARLGPVCRLSGRCCRFAEYDHTLFISAAEADLLLDEAPEPVRPLDGGATCPWQDAAGRCSAREARPLGCRVYYCDPGYQSEAARLSETFIARLKRLVDEHGRPWDYAPLHRHLHRAAAEGRFPRRETADPSPVEARAAGPDPTANSRSDIRGSEWLLPMKGSDPRFST